MSDYEFAYWKLAGLAQGIRYLLKAAKIDVKEVDYTMETGPKWFGEDKPQIAKLTDFPNLPYLKVGNDLVVTQSHAIFRYIGRNNNFNGKEGCEQSLTNIDVFDGLLGDVWSAWAKLMFNKEKYNEAEYKKEHHDKLLATLKLIDSYFAKEDNKFAAGKNNDKPSWVDFKALHMFNVILRWSKVYDSELSNLKAYNARVVSVSGIQEYFDAENDTRPLYPPNYTTWGHDAANNVKFDYEE